MLSTFIDNHFIKNDYVNNLGYFSKKNIIVLNCEFKIKHYPYYENSKHFLRDVSKINNINFENFNQFFTVCYKPIIKSNLISYNYYNVKKPRGKIIDYEKIPEKCIKYNVISNNFNIISIEFWYTFPPQKIIYDLKIYKNIFNDCSFKIIRFILTDFNFNGYYYYYKLFPKSSKNINIEKCNYLDFTDILLLEKDTKILIKINII